MHDRVCSCVKVHACFKGCFSLYACLCLSTRTLKLWSKLYIFWNTGLLIQDFPRKKRSSASLRFKQGKTKNKNFSYSIKVNPHCWQWEFDWQSGWSRQAVLQWNKTKVFPSSSHWLQIPKTPQSPKVQNRSFINSWHYIYWWHLGVKVRQHSAQAQTAETIVQMWHNVISMKVSLDDWPVGA